jgi:cysteine desulfurase
MLNLKEIAVSSGSACTSADPEPSHVLRAMGVSESLSKASLRFGLGRFTTADEIDFAVDYVSQTVSRLQRSV